jgi:non-specific serine/threonine protein kinase
MSVIDELYENRDENELVLKLEEKYENLKEFNKIKEIDLPEQLQEFFVLTRYLAIIGSII